ncbi:MAG TPA: sulfur transferase domain-containing protein [Croceibacterium sp.]|nr:sulfur transferase domain-containing protein [Croceibacterium sp.]
MSDPDDIRAWQRLSERVTTSGRLHEPDPARLAGIGVRHVINLAMPDHPEALPDPDGAFAAHGIGYTNIPVPFAAPAEAHYAAFVEALEAAEGPVHVHCIMNWRVSAFFYRYHRDACGMAEPEARALLEQQWSPETSDYPDAPVWAAFVKER